MKIFFVLLLGTFLGVCRLLQGPTSPVAGSTGASGVVPADALSSLVAEKPQSPASLGFALSKISRTDSAPGLKQTDDPGPSADPQPWEDPQGYLRIVRSQLPQIAPSDATQRVELLKQLDFALNSEFPRDLGAMLDEEQDWLATHALEISDPVTMGSYMFGLVELEIKNNPDPRARFDLFVEMGQRMAGNRVALEALRNSVFQTSYREIAPFLEGAAPDVRVALLGDKI